MTDTATPSSEAPPDNLPPASPQAEVLDEPTSEFTSPPAARAEPATAPQTVQRGGPGLLALLLGGALAAGAGFAVQRYGMPQPVTDTSALENRLTAAEAATEALRAEVARLSETAGAAAPVDQSLTDRVAALENAAAPELDGLKARIEAIEGNLAALANLPAETGVSPMALSALQADVAALKAAKPELPSDLSSSIAAVEQRLTEAEARAADLAAQAQAIATAATTRAALGQIRAAFDSGLPFGAALADLGDAPVPSALTTLAESGIPSLSALKAGFPDAARAALEAALRANMGESWTERVGAYLRNQTGARSLTPRDGTDPDAVLSRAEAALGKGDLPAAMTELAALPPEAQTAMAAWTATAQQRLDAQAALADLGQTLEQ